MAFKDIYEEVNAKPSISEKRKLGKQFLIASPCAGLFWFIFIFIFSGQSVYGILIILVLLMLLLGLCCILIPKQADIIYVAWFYLVATIEYFTAVLTLSMIYLLVVTPIGLTIRAFGFLKFQKTFDNKKDSYWIAVKQPENLSQYFKQF